MEFTGVGTISYEPPSEHLKPFFRRKYKTIFRFLNRKFGGGDLTKEHMTTVAQMTANKATVGETEKERIYKDELDILGRVILLDKDSISEEEYIEEWLDIVFEYTEKRKDMMNYFVQKPIPHGFETVDTDHSGEIDFNEFEAFYKIRAGNTDTTKKVFESIDVNGDGGISMMEWGYALLDFFFKSGPNNMHSFFFGSIVDDN